jgi:hypothetical protein
MQNILQQRHSFLAGNAAGVRFLDPLGTLSSILVVEVLSRDLRTRQVKIGSIFRKLRQRSDSQRLSMDVLTILADRTLGYGSTPKFALTSPYLLVV